MALVAKIREVGYLHTVEGVDGTTTVDLSLRGRFYVVADYLDDNVPATIIETQTFELPVSVTVADAQAHIVEFGQRVRDARARVDQLRTYVGATIPLN